MGFQISPLVNFSKDIFICKVFKVSWVAVKDSILFKPVLINVFSVLLYAKESNFPEGIIQVRMATRPAIIISIVWAVGNFIFFKPKLF
jgi:hypothetical protein